MTTMKQVAERAGVSTSTVSHVINNTRAVSALARERVLAIIDETRYIPSAIARSLKNHRTATLGVMVPNNVDPHFAELINAIEAAAFARSYSVMLCNGHADCRKQADYLRGLLAKRIDGLIVVAGSADATMAAVLSTAGVPLVLVDGAVAGVSADLVESDHQAGAALATRHLVRLGHRRIACVAGPPHWPATSQQVAGYRLALGEAGMPFDEDLLIHGDCTSKGGYQAVRQLLALATPPTAVFACSDLMALGGLCAAASLVQVPQQLSVIGYDNIALAACANPRLTTIAQATAAMGALATDLLLERIGGAHDPWRHAVLPTRLVERQSTAAASQHAFN